MTRGRRVRYSIGMDFGTQDVRAVLVEAASGKLVAQAQERYRHGVMEGALPSGRKLGIDWALQVATDYVEALSTCAKGLISESGVSPEEIIGIGVDTTSCTIMPVDGSNEPLSDLPRFADEPHAYVKMWKHHAAQGCANELNRIAEKEKQSFLKRYGGKISSEWMIPKIMQICEEAPEVYAAASRFVEIGDWLVYKLCGRLVKSNVMAGFKCMWSSSEGYPREEFFSLLNPSMRGLVAEKLSAPIATIGDRAGFLTPESAEATGLSTTTAVAVAHTDACVVPAALGLSKPGQMVMSIGTSTCHLLLGNTEREVPGICGVVEDGTLPGFFSYEAGQASVGDVFSWFVQHCTSKDLSTEAERRRMDIHELLDEKAQGLKAGGSGLVALDWFNGNRSVLVDVDLSGMVIGLNLQTRAEELYRAFIEATAFGTRKIIDTFESHGIPVNEIFACGGIAQKSPFIMQTYADICNRQIRVSHLVQASAFASSIFGAAAAGAARGGYDSVSDAVTAMANRQTTPFSPRRENVAVYDSLHAVYCELHDTFGRRSKAMKTLKEMRLRSEGK